MIAEGEIGPKRLAPDEPVLTPEELKEREYKDSEKFLKDRLNLLFWIRLIDVSPLGNK